MLNDKVVEENESRYEKLVGAAFFVVAVIVAFWVRFAHIGIKPFHHDEGVNSYFLLNLANHGAYKYDPTNYHGPTLYYFALVALKILGESDLALRFTPALFGSLTVAAIWLLRKRLGAVGTPVAAFLLALSPGLVYFSRDFIHEMSFGFFSLCIVIGAWRYAESKNFKWLALLAISAGLFFATKETAIVTVVVLIIAMACATALDLARNLIKKNEFSLLSFARDFLRECAKVTPSLDHFLAAVIMFVFINVIFYASFFSPQALDDGTRGVYWKGVAEAFKSIVLWTGRSGSEHVKDFPYYLGILLKLELPLLIGSLVAGVFILLRGSRFWLFLGAWTFGLALAYSIIKYKTPWLMISFLIPMGILSGYAAQRLYRAASLTSLKLLCGLGLLVVLIFNFRLMWTINFDKPDDNGNSSGYFTGIGEKMKLRPYVDGLYGYVYAQTDRDIFQLVDAIKNETDRLPSRNRTGIYMASPDYWPLPWYLRDYDQAAYTGAMPNIIDNEAKIPQPIIVANSSQRAELDALQGWRALPQAFTLRPGVELIVYVRDFAPQQQ
jgi:uncharacterized protein (TIGR03663 family)